MRYLRLASALASGVVLSVVGLGGSALAADNHNWDRNNHDNDRFDNNNFSHNLHAHRPSLEQFLRQVDPDDFRWNGHQWVRVRWDSDDQRYIRLYHQIFGGGRQFWDGHGWNWDGNHWDSNGNWNGHNNHHDRNDD